MNLVAAPGKRIAAFFDLDGTLIPEPSLERRFFDVLRRSDAIPFSNYIRWCVEAARLLPKGIIAVLHDNKRYLHGVSWEQALQEIETITFYDEGLARVAWHARRGHKVVLVSGTLEPLARRAADALGCELLAQGLEAECMVCATRLEKKAWRWTGRVVGEAMHGEAKSRVIRRIAEEEKLDLSRSYAYGNSPEDLQMLSAVGFGQTVNPGKEMAQPAKLRDWRIWHWKQKSESSPKCICREERVIQRVGGGV